MLQDLLQAKNVAAAFALLGLCVGCGDDGRLAVGGGVTYDGQPVATGSIGFVPVDPELGLPTGGRIVDGRYQIPRAEGPTAGGYRVVLYAEKATGRVIPADEGGGTETIQQMVQYLPPAYNDRTTLEVEILGDRDDLDFDLEKPKGAGRKRR